MLPRHLPKLRIKLMTSVILWIAEPSAFLMHRAEKSLFQNGGGHMVKRRKQIVLLLLTAVAGVLMGAVSAAFLKSLDFVTAARERQPLFFLLLPAVGVGTAWLYQKYGKGAQRGNNLIIDSVHENAHVPLRMALFTFVCTILTHLAGGSAGREGTAVQIGGTLSNGLGRMFRLNRVYRRILVMAGVSAGFGSVFGVPLAGAFFGMEVCFVGGFGYEAMLPCFLASFIADYVTRALGISHTIYRIQAVPSVNWYSLLVVVIAACAFGIAGRVFAVAIRALKLFYSRMIGHPLLRALVGSVVVLAVMFALRADAYGGLSTWLIGAGFSGKAHWFDPALKLLLTVLTLGGGFQGGEVTPLFDIGSSLGGWIGQTAHLSPSLLAALGMISVFGCAANTPLTTLVMGLELYGMGSLPYAAIAVFFSYYVSGDTGIYGAQRIAISKQYRVAGHRGEKLETVGNRSLTKYWISRLLKKSEKS